MRDPTIFLIEWLSDNHPMILAEYINTIYPGDDEE